MREKIARYFFNLPNLFFILTLLCFLLPSRYAVGRNEDLKSPLVFLILLGLIEIYFLFRLSKKKGIRAVLDVFAFIFAFFFIWELLVTRLDVYPIIFIPCPENVFAVFVDDRVKMFLGLASSLFLLLIGISTSLVCGVILGTFVGWNQRLTQAIYPISKAISTVPALVYTPYVILIMPTFRSASIFVIFLSGFWSTFMGSINNTAFVEKKVINSAKVLSLSTATILFKIIIPFNLPRIINNLPIKISAAIMTLTAAEMLGADNGIGYYIRNALNFGNYTKAIAGIFFMGFLVAGLNASVSVLKKHLIKWNY